MFIYVAETDSVGFEESLQTNTFIKALPCLENAMRMRHAKSVTILRWLIDLNDPDYEMVQLDQWELKKVASLLRRICPMKRTASIPSEECHAKDG